MPTAKATTRGDGKVDTFTSGGNAKASASARDEQGGEWFSTSRSKTKNGDTVTEKTAGRQKSSSTEQDGSDEESSGSSSMFEWVLGCNSKAEKGDEDEAEADAKTGNKATTKASSGKKGAVAGIVNGKAVASAG